MFFLMKYLSLGLFISSIPYVVIIIILKYYYDKRRLFILGNRLPGPRPWPIIGNALEFLPKNGDVLSKVTEFNRKYGLTSLWFGHVLVIFVCSPEDAEICFKSLHLRSKGQSYKFFEPIAGNGIFTAHGKQFEKPKKLMEPFFNNLSVQKYTDIYIEKMNVLLQCLEKEEGSQPFLIYPYIKKCTFDIICESILSIRLNAQQERFEPLEDIEAIFGCICDRIFRIWQHPDFIYKMSRQGKYFFQTVDRFKNFVESIIEKLKTVQSKESSVRRENGQEGEVKYTFVEKLMKTGEFTDEELRDQLTTIIAAGFEPTALATSFVLMMLGIHKDIQDKLYDEISEAFKNGLGEKDLYQLKYLEMVIKETIRLFPPIPYIGRKVDQDVQMGQHTIPEGAQVLVNIFAIHRNPKEYENPEAFNPDNFLPENIKKRHPCSYVPFAMGNRKCIGGKFAMISLRIIISKIVLKYKIDCDLKVEDIQLQNRILSEPVNGFIRITQR